MASRILTLVSCTLYLCLLSTLTIIGFAPIIIGSIGVGLFIPVSMTYNNYRSTTCCIVDVEYNTCDGSCHRALWSVEYYISNNKSSQYVFSTITQNFDTADEVVKEVALYTDSSNHTCYYDKTQRVRVQWHEPSSPRSYLIMIIIGFIFTAIYLILIGIFYCYRSNKLIKHIWKKFFNNADDDHIYWYQ